MTTSSDILRGKILIVDDRKDNVFLLERALQGAGYAAVESTMDSTEALELHRKNRYDLIILDLEMPCLDGFQVMESLKNGGSEEFLPVLAVTANPHHKLRALKAGARDFISKPFDLAEVLMRVHNMIETRLLNEAARKHAETLESLALNDPLTGLANRRLLGDRMAMALVHARRNKSAMAVLALDLDGFKKINDALGHGAGDALLKAVAERLKAAVRAEDTVARTGGDEFIIALWHIGDAGHAAAAAAKVIEAVSRPYEIDGRRVDVTASAGVAIYPGDGADADALMKSADQALYEAKNAGKNAYRISERAAAPPARPEAPATPAAAREIKAAAAPGGVVRIEFAPRTIAWLVAALAGAWLVYRLWTVVLLLLVALVFAGTFNPIVELLEERGLKRLHALILLICSLSVGMALLTFLTVPSLIDQFAAILRDLPAQRECLIALLGRHGLTAPLGRALNGIGVDQSIARLQNYLIAYSADAARLVGYGVTTFFLALYVLADGKRMQGTLYSVVPRDYHMRLARILHNLETIVGGYMRGQLLTSVALATVTFLLLTACEVRNALSLAFLAALLDIIPVGGGLLAIVPAGLTALAQGPQTAVVVIVCMSAYQIFEDKVLAPKIYWHTLRLSPAVVVLALIAGGTLLGMLGALLALPVAAALQMIIVELGVDLPGDDSDDPEARARDQRTEAAYELMSSGSTAHDAGQIANDLAHDLRDADAWVTSRAKKNGS